MGEKSYNICLDVGGTKVLGAIFNEKDENDVVLCAILRHFQREGCQDCQHHPVYD